MRLPLLFLLAAPALAAPPPSALNGFAEKDFKGKMETLDGMARTKNPLTKAEVALVVDILREDNIIFVRMKAADALALAQADLKLALAALVEALDDADEHEAVRKSAAKTLGEIARGSKRVEAALKRAGENPTLNVQMAAALANLNSVKPSEKVQANSGGETIRPKTPASTAPAVFDGKDDAFVAALTGMDLQLRRAAIRSVFKRGFDRKLWSEAEVEAIRKAASDTDIIVRRSAINALGLMNESSKMIPMLIELLKNPDSLLVESAASALTKAGPIPVKDFGTILEVLESSKALNTRVSLMQTLSHFGEAAKPAVPVLCKLLKDPIAQVRNIAASTLLKVGSLDPETVVKALKELPPEQDMNIAPRIKQLRDTFVK